jgi:pimeloyl-ACP methyl ester carboxylesterase
MADNNNNDLHYDDFPDYTLIDTNIPYREYAPPVQPHGNGQQARPGTPPARGEMMPPPYPPINAAPPGQRPPFPPSSPFPPNPVPRPAPPQPPSMKWVYIAAGILGVVLVIVAATSSVFFYRQQSATQAAHIQATATAKAIPTPAYKATYHAASCPFTPASGIVEGQDVNCGFLAVPENRDQPHGKTIQLAVAIFKGSGNDASSIPDFYLTGGPGGGVLSDLGPFITSSNLRRITLSHDLILLDQRGTGYSHPALNCPEFTDLENSTANETLTNAQENKLYVQAAQKCHDRLTKSGVDLNMYTTIANATDVHDLIGALGYKQVNLYGVSYGTRLALTVMRLFPNDIRSVILDSTVPTQSNLFTALPAVTQHAFDVLFHGCKIDAHCNSTNPQVEDIFYNLVTRMNAHPISFQDAQYGPVQLNGDGLASWLFGAQYITRLIPLLPSVIMQINEGNYKLISQYYGYVEFSGGISYGMYYSVECGEDLAFLKPQDLVNAANVARPEIRAGLLANIQDSYDVCQIWGQKPVPAAQKQPVTSSLPTLILSGEYDPITPPSNGKMAQSTLHKSFFYQFPATGHGVFYTDTCPDTIMMDFLRQPTAKPDTACIASMPEPSFQ